MLGDKFRLFDAVISQYRNPIFNRKVYKLPKLCKLFWSDSCFEFSVSFCFHNGIADAVDNILTTASCRFECPLNATFGNDSFLQILIELYQRIFCFSYFYEKFITSDFSASISQLAMRLAQEYNFSSLNIKKEPWTNAHMPPPGNARCQEQAIKEHRPSARQTRQEKSVSESDSGSQKELATVRHRRKS